MSVVVRTTKAFKHLFNVKPYTSSDYLELLLFSFNIFKIIKIKGMLEIQSHIENSEDSEIFNKAPSLKKQDFAYDFTKDNIRLLTMGVENPYDFEML